MKIKKKISNLFQRFSNYCDVKFWPLEGDFPLAFQKIGCHINTKAAECMKISTRVFLGPWESIFEVKNTQKWVLQGVNSSWKKFHAHTLSANMVMLANGCKKNFLPML